MNITNNSVVSLEFELRDEEGELLDSSAENGPMLYLHGQGQIPLRLEQELEEKTVDDEFEIKLSEDEGYGAYDENLVQTVNKEDIDGVEDLSPGSQFPAKTENGMMVFTVLQENVDSVVLDTNHSLAGEELNFKIKVLEVRKATKDELDHGHVHGPGGHEH